MPAVRFVTFNVRYGTAKDGPDAWPHRAGDVARLVLSHARGPPLLVGFQEVLHWQYGEILRLLGDGWVGMFAGRDDGALGGEGTAFVWRGHELFCTGPPAKFWYSDAPDVPGSISWNAAHPRFCMRARFVAVGEDGAPFDAAVTHFDYVNADIRRRSAEMVTARLLPDDAPLVFMGDLNAPPTEPAIACLRSHFTDALLAADPSSDGIGTFHGFTGRDGGRGEHIDYIFVREGRGRPVRVVRAAVDRTGFAGPDGKRRWPSDHFAVVADIEL
ncbi:Endonuclease/exonuclease/phosphatase [Hyaloraphidium curvatum]|nr:Endonuclease/exonuclease/phosphatase [Hyaloraphidium curvatum]